MAVGNVVGSNIFNVLFILGLSALITPLVVDKQLIRQEVPIMIGVSLLLLRFALGRQRGGEAPCCSSHCCGLHDLPHHAEPPRDAGDAGRIRRRASALDGRRLGRSCRRRSR
jgi:hypothetical protein